MMARAIAAQVIWIGHPSGTVSSTMSVINRRPNAAKRAPSPRTSNTGKAISPQPDRNAITVGGKRIGAARQMQLELVGEQGHLSCSGCSNALENMAV
jgi:hypothetical protein